MEATLLTPLDTSPVAQTKIYHYLRRLSPEERFIRMNAFCAFGRFMMIEGIKEQHPGCGSIELRRHLAYRLFEPAIAARLSGRGQ